MSRNRRARRAVTLNVADARGVLDGLYAVQSIKRLSGQQRKQLSKARHDLEALIREQREGVIVVPPHLAADLVRVIPWTQPWWDESSDLTEGC
jgi:hypothetical protein